MADVLSQSEIDALLNAINSGSVDVQAATDTTPATKIRPYDFRTANRFSKEQIRTISIIYENFAHLFASFLSGVLRSMVQIEVGNVEELKYNEFVNALPVSVVLSIFSMPPLVGPTLVEVSPDVAYAMISRLLGGNGAKAETSRNYTEIELVLLERILRQMIRYLDEAWSKVIAVNTIFERIETSSQFAQIVALNETVALTSLTVKIGEQEGLMNICLPHVAIEPISKKLNTKTLFQTNTEHHTLESANEDIRQRIQNTPLTVTAVFNETLVSVRDIVNLQVGDVLQLEHKVDTPVLVKVGHLDKFRADIGIKENRNAVKIAEIIHEEENVND